MKRFITPMALATSLLITSPAFANEHYVVKSGDTLSEIASEYGLSLQEVINSNPQIADPNLIYVGDKINLNEPIKTVETATSPVASKWNLTSYEKDLLARLVRAEAQSEPFAGKVAVATVVLNRVESEMFPDTVHDVIFQAGQFSPVSNGSINKPADDESIRAVEEAVTNQYLNQGTLYFYNPKLATSRWLDDRPTVSTIGNHVFKK